MSNQWDELASAHLDGEATPEEIAYLEAEPTSARILDELGAIAHANADVPQPPPGVRDRHLASALDLFDELQQNDNATQDSSTQDTAPQDIGPQNGAPQDSPTQDSAPQVTAPVGDSPASNVIPFRRRPGVWMGRAAAAVVVVAGLGIATTQLGNSGSDSVSEEIAASPSGDSAEMLDSSAANEGEFARSEDFGDESALDSATNDQEAASTAVPEAETADAGAPASDTTESSDTADTSTADTSTADDEWLHLDDVVLDLLSDDDILAEARALGSAGFLSENLDTASGEALLIAQARCRAIFDDRAPSVAAIVTVDGVIGLLISTPTPTEQALVVSQSCEVLAAAG